MDCKIQDVVKCVVVGDSCVGKSWLLKRATTGEFTEYIPTVFDNLSTQVLVEGGRRVELRLFDTSGMEDLDRWRPLSYPNTDVFLICFSVIGRSSYVNVTEKWVAEIQHHCPTTPYILVGTKMDLREDEETVRKLSASRERPISYEEGVALGKKISAVTYIECSAVTLKNADKLLQLVTQREDWDGSGKHFMGVKDFLLNMTQLTRNIQESFEKTCTTLE